MNKKSKNWIDYKEIKGKVSMEMILKHYGLLDKLKPSGRSLTGCCPIHQGTNTRQFSVNLQKNVFNCFGDCQAGGNIIDFVARMEKCDIKEAAQKITAWFLGPGSAKKDTGLVREGKEVPPADPETKPLNSVLKFKLKTLPEHQFFIDRDITQDTVKHFDLGFCSRGLMANRIVIPINNENGELVAYCGRALNKEDEEKEKYKLPPGFNKSLVIYNLDKQAPGTKTLITVESFLSVYRLYQAGFSQAITFLGSSMSPEQANLLLNFLSPAGQVLLLFDADEAGKKCTDKCLACLTSKLFVKALDILPLAKKPHQVKEKDLKSLLAPYF